MLKEGKKITGKGFLNVLVKSKKYEKIE